MVKISSIFVAFLENINFMFVNFLHFFKLQLFIVMSASKNQSECQNTAFLLVVLEFIEEGEFRCIVGLFRVVLGDFVRIRLGVLSGLFIEGPLRVLLDPMRVCLMFCMKVQIPTRFKTKNTEKVWFFFLQFIHLCF